jgi:transposase
MARRPISMRKAREILRLKHELGLTNRQIGASLHMSHVSVGKYLQRASQAGVGWPLPVTIDEGQMRELLRAVQRPPEAAGRPLPPMAQLHQELRRPGVTLQLLWEEYRRESPHGYAYTQFCEYYKRFRIQLEPSLRQPYRAGEKLFVDWAGQRILLYDPTNGQSRPAYLFVAVMGASNYTYAEAFENHQLPAWIEAHVHAWEFFGGVTTITVPDNEKTGVTHACRYEPDLNRTYQEVAEHYGTVVIPARAGEPKDKSKVENAVLNAERRILAVLRDRRFFSLGELNAAVRQALEDLNERPFQKMPGCRRTLFEQLDRPALRPLPAARYELAGWQKAKVNIDYHVQVDWHLYSVPYRLIHQPVEVRLTPRTVEILHQGRRVALHPRSQQRGGFTTDPAHRPKSHQQHLEWTPGRLIHWADQDVGEHGGQVVRRILENNPHPEQGYRSCLGLMRLGRSYGKERLECACQRAVRLGACSYRSIKSILKTKLDLQPMPGATPPPITIAHPNVRGAEYYQQPASEEASC